MLPSASVASTPSSSASLSNLQGNHLTANGLATPTSQSSMDAALTQAYTGIQQYAGLSGLLNQGKNLTPTDLCDLLPADWLICTTDCP